MKKRIDIYLLLGYIILFISIIIWAIFDHLPKPVANRGEFPFKLIYEINGERHTFEDTLVVEYKGISYGSNGRTIKFNRYFLSEKDIPQKNRTLNTGDLIVHSIEKNGIKDDIKFYIGSSEYYLGIDQTEKSKTNITAGDFFLDSSRNILSENELYEEYGIKIIEKYVSPPLTKQ